MRLGFRGNTSCEFSPNEGVGGSACYKFKANSLGVSWALFDQETAFQYYGDFSFEAGKTYRLSMDVKCSAPLPNGGKGIDASDMWGAPGEEYAPYVIFNYTKGGVLNLADATKEGIYQGNPVSAAKNNADGTSYFLDGSGNPILPSEDGGTITTSWKTLVYEFTAKGEGYDATYDRSFILAFSALTEETLYIDNLFVREVKEEEPTPEPTEEITAAPATEAPATVAPGTEEPKPES